MPWQLRKSTIFCTQKQRTKPKISLVFGFPKIFMKICCLRDKTLDIVLCVVKLKVMLSIYALNKVVGACCCCMRDAKAYLLGHDRSWPALFGRLRANLFEPLGFGQNATDVCGWLRTAHGATLRCHAICRTGPCTGDANGGLEVDGGCQ